MSAQVQLSLVAALTCVVAPACDQLVGDKAAPEVEDATPERPRERRRPRAISPTCGFLVELPFRRANAPTPAQLLDAISAEDRFKKVAVSANCADLKSVSSPSTFFDISSRGMLEHLGATLISKEDIELQGRKGVEIRARIPAEKSDPSIGWTGEQDVRLRTYLSGKRAYQLTVLQSAANTDADEVATTFFDSFELRADAPPPSPPVTWTRQVIGDFAVEAPGKATPQDRGNAQASHDVWFEHEGDRTGYSVRIWTNTLPSRSHSEKNRLDAFFGLVFETEHSEIVSRKHLEHGEWSALDVSYHQNLPIPDSIAASDPKVRKVVDDTIAERKPGDHVRLVLAGDVIVELRARMEERADRVKWFFESLEPADAPTE